MTLTELQDEVITITGRPDKTALTLAVVRAATLKLHQLDYFYKDLFETGLAFSTPAYLQQIEYRALMPRFRAIKYIRKSDINGTDTGAPIGVITPEEVLDDYGRNRTDVCYVAGETIQIRSSTNLQYIFFGCYLNPDITVSGYNSWIAKDHPYAIIYEAAAQVFKAVGKNEEWQVYTLLAQEQRQTVVVSNLQPVGY